jgi:hypothetical protein
MKTETSYLSLIIILLFAAGELKSQRIPAFGIVVKEEIEMKEYEKDKDAEAVVLFDLGKSSFVNTDNGFDVLFERRTRIKIFNKAGYKHADVAIWYYREGNIFEKVFDLEAVTYNFENGVLIKTPLDVKATYDEKVNEYWNIKKFAMPNVKEGSIIEFKYKIQSPYKFNLRDWNFQSSIPTIYSEYELRSIPFYTYTYIFQGASKFHKNTVAKDNVSRNFRSVTFNDMIYVFAMKDLAGFTDEEFITSKNDYLIKMDFQLASFHEIGGRKTDIVTTWPKLCDDLLKGSYGKFLKGSEKASGKIIDFSETAGKTEMEKIEYIVNAVKANFSWNNRFSRYPNKTINEFLKEKNGTSTNINLFLTGALRAAGINASPVLISTRSHGKIKVDYPFAHFFNSTIALAKLSNGMLLLDATDPNCPFNIIPVECINEKGLVVEKNSGQWVELSSAVTSYVARSFEIKIDTKSDSLLCQMDIRSDGYDAINMRDEFGGNTEDVAKHFQTKGFIVSSPVVINNFADNMKVYNIKLNASTKPESFADKIYVPPFLMETLSENPFRQSSRSYPVDMVYSKNRIFTSTIVVPENYKIESLPRSSLVNNDLVAVELKVMLEEGVVRITGNYAFKKAVYQPSEYARLKHHFNEIIRVFNEKVVLVREDLVN